MEAKSKKPEAVMSNGEGLAYGEVIRQRRKGLGLTQPQLASALGVQKNAVSNWEQGRSRPDLGTVPALCRVLKLSLADFFGAPDTSLPGEERRLLNTYRSLGPYNRRVARMTLEGLSRLEQLEHTDAVRPGRSLVRHELKVCAGDGNELDEERSEPIRVVSTPLTQRADAVFVITGRSMEPDYFDGDQVLVKYTRELRDGEVGIFIVNGAGTIKEKRAEGLFPRNPEFQPILPEEGVTIRCVGRVLGRLMPEEELS